MRTVAIITVIAAGIVLVGVSGWSLIGRRRRRDPGPAVGLTEHLDRWSSLHGGIDPAANPLVRRWLTGIHRLARPLAQRRVPPNLVSGWGVWVAGLCVWAAVGGGRLALLGAALVVVNGVLDGLDGAVAVLSNRVGRHGKLIDSTADRLSDGLLLLALVAAGAPWWFAAIAAALIGGLEGTRAVALRRGKVARVTPGERPTRLILAALGLLTVGAVPSLSNAAASVAVGATAFVVAASWVFLWIDVRPRPGR